MRSPRRAAPPRKTDPERGGEAGVTLVEVLVALVLFALIGMAGFSVLDQVMRVQERTEGRLARLSEMQRAMHVVKLDLMQASVGSLGQIDGMLSFRRGSGMGDISVRYALEDDTLVRSVAGGVGAARVRQRLLSGVSAIRWSFLDADGAWVQVWPPEAAPAPADPVAVALDLELVGADLSGGLRRVAGLVARARP